MKCDIGLRHRNYTILSGGILTAWPYLEQKLPAATQRIQIIRLRLDANNRVIGKYRTSIYNYSCKTRTYTCFLFY